MVKIFKRKIINYFDFLWIWKIGSWAVGLILMTCFKYYFWQIILCFIYFCGCYILFLLFDKFAGWILDIFVNKISIAAKQKHYILLLELIGGLYKLNLILLWTYWFVFFRWIISESIQTLNFLSSKGLLFCFLVLLFLPLLSSCLVFFCGAYYTKWELYSIVVISLWISFFMGIILCYNVFLDQHQTNYYVTLGTWFSCSYLNVAWEFNFDFLSASLVLVVLSISAIIHHYSYYYMEYDPQSKRFVGLLVLFTFFMLFLLLADNFVVLFAGWEGVGFISYLLINFWYTRVEANRAGLKALIFNRIGDFFFILGIGYCAYVYSSINFSSLKILIINSQMIKQLGFEIYSIKFFQLDIICFCLFIAALAKSAQLCFYPWLADAMEGPTPVSALLHSATMVTAGVYLVLRCNIFFFYSDIISICLLCSGIFTSLITGFIACAQWDIKKIIAYSTCSQIGLMFVACGSKAYAFALYHLITHAYAKALLFLCAGVIIHFFSGEQDIRKMGSVQFLLPLVHVLMFAANLSLIGFPFTSGFYSKEGILLSLVSITSTPVMMFLSCWYFSVLTILTACYSLRLLYYVFWQQYAGFFQSLKKATYKLPDYVLNLLTFCFMISMFIGPSLTYFFLYFDVFMPDLFSVQRIENGHLYDELLFMMFIVIFLNLFLALCVYIFIKKTSFFNKKKNFSTTELRWVRFQHYFFLLANKGFFLDSLFNWIGLKILAFGFLLHSEVEKGILEFFGPRGLYLFGKYFSSLFKHQNSSFFVTEIMYILFCNILFCFLFLFILA